MIKNRSLNHRLKTIKKEPINPCVKTQAHCELTVTAMERPNKSLKLKRGDFKHNLSKPADKNRLELSKINPTNLGTRIRILLDLN